MKTRTTSAVALITMRCVLALVIGWPLAAADTLRWINSGGGNASTPENWSPARTPVEDDDLVFDLANPYNVSFDSFVPVSYSHTYRAGDVTLTILAPHALIGAGGIKVGGPPGQVAILRLVSGAFSSGDGATIGDEADSVGSLIVRTAAADLLLTTQNRPLVIGNQGIGALTVENIGRVQSAGPLRAALAPGSTANIVVTGARSQAPFTRSELQVDSTSVSRIGERGTATLTVSNAGRASFAGHLTIADGASSTASVTVGQVVANQRAALSVGGNLNIGRNGVAGAAAGNATMTLEVGSQVTVTGDAHLGNDPDGGTGALRLTGGTASFSCRSLFLGAGGTLDLSIGTLTIRGGVLQLPVADFPLSLAGPNPDAQPILSLEEGATFAAGNTVTLGAVADRRGKLIVLSGSQLSVAAGDLDLAAFSQSRGTLEINGPGSTALVANTTRVGKSGIGTMNVAASGIFDGSVLELASQAGSSGSLQVTDDAAVRVGSRLAIAGTSTDAGGVSTVNLRDGGNIVLTGFDSGLVAWPGATIEIEDRNSFINANGSIALHGADVTVNGGRITSIGDIRMVGGRIHLGEDPDNYDDGQVRSNDGIQLLSNAVIDGQGIVEAPIFCDSGGGVVALQNDFTLTVGKASSPNGFAQTASGIVRVESGVNLYVLDADHAEMGTVAIQGGQLIAVNGIALVPGGTITGEGVIVASEIAFDTGESIITSRGANGLAINGRVRNNGGSITGPTFRFYGAGAGWTGAGRMESRVLFDMGTELNATGDIVIGLASGEAITFAANTAFHANQHNIQMIDNNGVRLATVTDLDGGVIACAQPLAVDLGRRLSGRGSLDSPLTTIYGSLSPGGLSGVAGGEFGRLVFTGDLALLGSAVTAIEIGGAPASPLMDRVSVSGVARLGGTLEVALAAGFVPQYGDTYVLMTYEQRMGSFSTISISPHACGGTVFVRENDVVLRMKLTGDVDNDRDVDLGDLANLLAEFGCATGRCIIDFDGDGATGLTDLAMLLAHFGRSCP